MTTSQISETEVPVASASAEAETSVLINVSTPAALTPICRLGNRREILGELTVRQLIEKVVNPKSLFSVGVPMSQLEAEGPAALAVGEILAAGECEVFLCSPGKDRQPISPDDLALSVAQARAGAQGSDFLALSLEVRPVRDNVPPGGVERRQITAPEVVEAEVLAPAPAADETAEQVAAVPTPTAGNEAIVAIVARVPPRRARTAEAGERKDYVRKADFLRAQFQPEVEALNFTGLFVGNLGLGIREEQGRRQVVLADPARITDILLRGNGHRRAGEHAKALICYQELVDMDPGNPDFRFLLGKTLLELGQVDQATEALARARELGHDGAAKELDGLRRAGLRGRRGFGFLRFWKQ